MVGVRTDFHNALPYDPRTGYSVVMKQTGKSFASLMPGLLLNAPWLPYRLTLIRVPRSQAQNEVYFRPSTMMI